MAVIVLGLVAQPLRGEIKKRKPAFENFRQEQNQLEGLQESALAERRVLEDLDFDRELGIIEEKDYTELKQRSEVRLEGLREEIDLLRGKISGQPVTFPKPSRLPGRNRATVTVAQNQKTQGNTATKTRTGDTGKFAIKSAVKEKLKCGECGTPFKPGDRFCRQCSAPLPLLCLNCGKEVTEDDRFCANCGSAVNT
jgi:predicted nucleic acid-binding Zn ribbon protein